MATDKKTSSPADAPRSPTPTEKSDPKSPSHLQVPHLQQGLQPQQLPQVPDHMEQIEQQRRRDRAEAANEAAERENESPLELGAELDYHDADGKVRRVRVTNVQESGLVDVEGDGGFRVNGVARRAGAGAGYMRR